MKALAAIEAPAVSLAEMHRMVSVAHVAVLDAERKEEEAEKLAGKVREAADRRRLECGRALATARPKWSARGPSRVEGKTWAEFLADLGIEERTARRYMDLAGYIEKVSDSRPSESETPAPVPTQREVAAARKAETAPPPVHDMTEDVEEVGASDPPAPVVVLAVAGSKPAAPEIPQWMRRVESLVGDVRKHISSAFSKAEEIEALCAEHEASVNSPALLTTRSMLVAVKTTASGLLKKMEPTP